ncbi:MAG: hypothetical protein KDD94_14910 [Calditrichaeota bacterium]|nr:hypothetical protein [Calditrichota bacterium]
MKILLIFSVFICACDPINNGQLKQDNPCNPTITMLSRDVFVELTNSEKPFLFIFDNSYIHHNQNCILDDSAILDVTVQNNSVDTVSMAFKIVFKKFGNTVSTHFGWRLDYMRPGESRKLFAIADDYLDDLNSYDIQVDAHEISYSDPN